MYCSHCGAVVADSAGFCPSCGQAQAPGSAAVGAVPPRYAGFWIRFFAYVIDRVIITTALSIVIVPLLLATGLLAPLAGRIDRPEWLVVWLIPMVLGFIAVTLLAECLYFALMESSSWQATLGKKALNLIVTDVEGRRISLGRAVGRYFAKILSGLILYIGFIMAGFTEKKQALHDIIVGTLVVRRS
jgi:uncharacterized RDD family membrane protein YckC